MIDVILFNFRKCHDGKNRFLKVKSAINVCNISISNQHNPEVLNSDETCMTMSLNIDNLKILKSVIEYAINDMTKRQKEK